ncbi:hypothetical protein ACFQX7_36985 [Luedemannella flava]
MGSSRKRLRFLVAALFACLALFGAVAAVAAARHLVAVFDGADTTVVALALAVGDGLLLAAVIAAPPWRCCWPGRSPRSAGGGPS